MALPEMNVFARDDVFPSWFANALQKRLSTGAPSFTLVQKDATHIEVPAGTGEDAAVISIAGSWRWVEAPVTRAHPGGVAGSYDIFVVAKANKVTAGIDETDYSYELRILASGTTPPIEAGIVDDFRKVGSLQWSGAEITRVDQAVPPTPTHAHRHATGQPDALTPAAIGAAAETGVAGDFTVGAILSSSALDVGALAVSGPLEAGNTLAHSGGLLGVFNATPVARSSGWGTPTPPGGSHKAPLSYGSTPDEVIDLVMTLVGYLKTLGFLAA